MRRGGRGRRLTYGELDERVNRAAAVLRAAGVSRGDRVALLAENRPEYLELELACAMMVAILACQNRRLAPPELRHCIGLVSPTPVVIGPTDLEIGRHSRYGNRRYPAPGAPSL